MFYEQDILEGFTKKTFYDSSRIVLTDLEQIVYWRRENVSLPLLSLFSHSHARVTRHQKHVTRLPHSPQLDHLRSLTLQCLSATILTIRISPFSPPSQAHPPAALVLQVRVNDARSRRTSSHRVLDILLPHKIDEKLCSALFSFHRSFFFALFSFHVNLVFID